MADSSNKYHYLNRLPIEELEKLLELAVDPLAEDEDSVYVDAILEVIAKKEKAHPTGRFSDVDEAWTEFQTHYNTEEGKGQSLYYAEEQRVDQPQAGRASLSVFAHKRIRRTLLAAALIALLIAMTTIPVFGYSNVIQMAAHWTAEQFSFRQTGPVAGRTRDGLPVEVPEEYEELFEAFQQRNLTGLVVPQNIPDGFQVVDSDLYTLDSTDEVEFHILYKKDSDTIGFDLEKTDSPPTGIFEKDDNPVEIYRNEGIEFYIFSNNDYYVSVWYTNSTQYSVGTTLSVENLKQIIHSMYEE